MPDISPYKSLFFFLLQEQEVFKSVLLAKEKGRTKTDYRIFYLVCL